MRRRVREKRLRELPYILVGCSLVLLFLYCLDEWLLAYSVAHG